MLLSVPEAIGQFDFYRDTFAFRNELHWEYLVDGKTGRVTTRRNEPRPTYAHRCFVVVRSARQFLFHARFAPEKPAITEDEYRGRIRQVVSRPAWEQSSLNNRVEIPGYAGLREFSEAHAQSLKKSCGPVWHSYVNRKHWRMLFPFSRAGQAQEAERLVGRTDSLPIIHVVRFPQLTINHALMIFGATRTGEGIEFGIYDPNLPEAPSTLKYSAKDKTFYLPRNIYWAGGRVDVYETYVKP
jgi:hypothetical protein